MKINVWTFLLAMSLLCPPIYALYVEPKTKHNPGIKNQKGDDCFLNVSMQVLTNFPGLDQLLTSNYYQEYSIPGQIIAFQNALRTFDFSKGNVLGAPYFDIESGQEVIPYGSASLRNYITNASMNPIIQYMGNGNQDAQEFLSSLIAEIALDEHLPLDLKNSFKKMFGISLLQKNYCSACTIEQDKEEVGWILMLHFPPGHAGNMLLSDFFPIFFAQEELKDFACGTCGTRGKTTKKTTIKEFPEILIFYLQRNRQIKKGDGSFEAEKINIQVAGEETIKISDDFGEKTFHFIARIDHGGAHYTTYVKDLLDKRWYFYNDLICEPSSLAAALSFSEKGYLYCYVRDDIFNKPYSLKNLDGAVRPNPFLLHAHGGALEPIKASASEKIDLETEKKLSTLCVDHLEKKRLLASFLKGGFKNPKAQAEKTVFDLFIDFLVGLDAHKAILLNPAGKMVTFFGSKSDFEVLEDAAPEKYFDFFDFLMSNFVVPQGLQVKIEGNAVLKSFLDANEEGFKMKDLIALLNRPKVIMKDLLAQKLDHVKKSLKKLRKKLQNLRDQLAHLKAKL